MCVSVTKGHSGDACDLASTKYLIRAANVWWSCVHYFVIASCG